MATHEAKMIIWHDLTEDPEDLPKGKCGRYLLSAHYKDNKITYPYIYTLTDCSYFPKGYWYDREGRELPRTTVVVAWAEMPKAYIPDSKKVPKNSAAETLLFFREKYIYLYGEATQMTPNPV